MSRKRGKDKRVEEAVPDEVLAEGSGPNEVVDANAQSLVAAAQDLVDKRKERKAKGKKPEAVAEGAPDEGGEAVDAVEAAADEPEARPKKGKRGKKTTDEAPEASEVSDASDASELAESDVALAAAEAAAAHPEDFADSEPAEETAAEDEAAFDAAADNVAPESVAEATAELMASAEGEAVEAVEDAVMRAEAEAELGDAELEGEEDIEGGAALPTSAASMDAPQLKNLVEALVFAADKPLTLQRLRQLTRVSDVKRLEKALEDITAEFQNRGIALQIVSGGYQFRTNTQYSVWVQQLIAGRPVRLSRAQLETLAIVAYRQPITRPEIDDIRGVDSSATLRLLLDRSLIRTLGKKEDVGRPMLYGTTKDFLDFFSLNDLRELPTLREYSELTAESRKVMSDELGVDESELGVVPLVSPEGDELAASSEVFDTSAEPFDDGDAESERSPLADALGSMEDTLGDVEDDRELEAAESAEAEAEEAAQAAAENDGDLEAAFDTDAEAAVEAVAAVDASATADAEGQPSAPGHSIRDGVEYDRWGQPLGPVSDDDDESVRASAGEGDEGSAMEPSPEESAMEASADESSATDESLAASSDAEAAHELGAPAGAPFEARANLDEAGNKLIAHGETSPEDREAAGDGETSGDDSDALERLAAKRLAAADADDAETDGGGAGDGDADGDGHSTDSDDPHRN